MRILKCYPFNLESPSIKLVEGFKSYVGYLGDRVGIEHKGIDYVKETHKGRFVSFDVFSAHDGEVFQGRSKSWGRFVITYKEVGKSIFATVYAHLRIIDQDIPILPEKREGKKGNFLVIREGRFLGRAGITGWTKRKTQLHFELLRKNKKGDWVKIDPYGINGITRDYPQPGESLKGFKHLWTNNNPLFASEI